MATGTTLVVLCCVLFTHGVQGWWTTDSYWDTPGVTGPQSTPPEYGVATPGPGDNGGHYWTPDYWATAQPSCRYNCGYEHGSCSCYSSCVYYGTCCYDYSTYCDFRSHPSYLTTEPPHPSCGGDLHGSGSFSSPFYPNYYHDNGYCVWRLSAPSGQRVFLSFTDLQLENCCVCDYISIYDGSSIHSGFLGKVCEGNGTQDAFHSSSNYMTVVFRSDGSVVGRGFHGVFSSSLPSNMGRVDCSSDNLNIVIQRSYLTSMGYDGNNLYLNDQHCRPHVGPHEVVFSFPVNTCGTERKFVNGRVVYSNGVRAYTSSVGEITRQSHFELAVGCRMEQDTMVQIMYVANTTVEGVITGTGRFNATIAFYTSSSLLEQVTEVPYNVALNQRLFAKVKLRRDDSSLVLFVDTCVASPSPHDFHTRSYDLIRNGCARDSTYATLASGSYAGFRFESFKFLRAHESVYLQCKILICEAADYNSRCRRGCQRRKARDLRSAHDSQTLVLGPFQLQEDEKHDEGLPKEKEVKAHVGV